MTTPSPIPAASERSERREFAHALNNVLNVIAMQAEVANQFAARGEVASCRDYLERLQRECRVAAATVKAYCDIDEK